MTEAQTIHGTFSTVTSLPLRVGLDVSALNPNFKAHAARGIGRYVRELSAYLDGVSRSDLTIGKFEHEKVIGSGPLKKMIDWAPLGRTTLQQQMLYPFKLNTGTRSAFDILHFPAHMDPPAWGLRNYIVTVLDLVPLVLADLYKAINPNWRFRLARFLELRAIINASLIIAISENTAKDVHQILGVPHEKIVVTHLGIDKKFFIEGFPRSEIEAVLQKYNIPIGRDIVLYLGGIDPRKNIPALIGSYKILRDKGQVNNKLVIAGKISDDKQYPFLLETIKRHGLESEVVITGFMPDNDLWRLFAATKVFFFPSLYEGFGFTPLEAMAAGIPVVSSNKSCMPEVLGDSAILVEPTNHVAFADALAGILSNTTLRTELSRKGRERASMFPWSKTGEETLKAYLRFKK